MESKPIVPAPARADVAAGAAGTAPEPVPETTSTAAAAHITPVPANAFIVNLRSGARAAFFLPVRESDFAPSFMQAHVFALLLLLSIVLSGMARAGLNGHLGWYGVPVALTLVSVLLWAAMLMCAGSGQPGKTLALFTALLAAALFVYVGFDALRLAAEKMAAVLAPKSGFRDWWSWLLPVWMAASTMVLALRFGCMRGLGGVSAVVAGAVFAAAGLGALNQVSGMFWQVNEPVEVNAGADTFGAAAHEDVIYAQPRLLGRALGALTPGRADVPNLYYVGMAGYASQDVFMKEVIAAESIFKERFGAEGRTVKLINNRKTLAEVPAAGINTLQAALDGVGRVMDKEKDILFLFLTSHGGRDHKFSLDMWPWRFGDLDPKRLRGLIDASGIKWKVVVVSACYSGGFVEALKSPTTLVITASAPDKNSFGCSNEAEFTYFGKAYFDQALRKTTSFTEAFELARAEVLEREAQEKQTPSEPQIALGAEIAVKLQAFEAGLRTPLAGAPKPGVAATAMLPAAQGLDAAYVQLAQVEWSPTVMNNDQRLCAESQMRFGPAERVKGDPDYFGGIKPGHALWSGVVAAFERYAGQVCADRKAEEWWREYAAILAKHLPAIEAQAAARHFGAPQGVHYQRAVAATDVEMGNERARWSGQMIQRADGELNAALAAMYRERDTRAAGSQARR